MSQCAVWDFRANGDMFTDGELSIFFKSYAKKWTFQKENSDNGYIHWQGRFSLIKKRDKNKLMDLFDVELQKIPNYLQPTLTENHKEEFFYAQKKDTRLEGPWTDQDKAKEEVYIPRQYRDIKLYNWQQQIINSAENFNDREINLIYDPKGCNGKSTVASIAELKYGGIDMPPLNDYKELIQLACNICMDSNNRTPKIMFFDMPRAIDKSRLYGLYSAIEQIKKGKLYDIRYKYKAFWIDSPVIWVFTNASPDLSMLSSDRWKVWKFSEDKSTLEPYQDAFL